VSFPDQPADPDPIGEDERSSTDTYDDEYASCARTYVTLRIYDLDPHSVSRKLQIEPTRILIKGERREPGSGRSSRPARVNGWFLTSEGAVRSRDVRRHLDWLLDQLAPHTQALINLQTASCRMDVSCFWSSAWGHGGPTLSPSIMRRLAALELETWFDVYVDTEDESSDVDSGTQE
jgi:hypothetical protein